ncbi:unnamed protein product [Clonostachys solani]|uniref:Nucleoporin NUP53 n=1 Tax=Clonostachys solani TaxID=160281 RepID=A0A9N9W4A2_9HYPO|nr:unnamed protein product [Clonostachys solani]
MAPLILHNVPDDECYIGDDGVKRPYAMIFNQPDAHTGTTRSRRNIGESGSFGKSTRRSRSRTGTPAQRGRENKTLVAADKLFGDWVAGHQATASATQQRESAQQQQDDSQGSQASQQQQQQQQQQLQTKASQPVEIMLRGYRSSTQQYAAVSHFESLAGIILEDYPREPPPSQRRYKSQLRDPAFRRQRTLNAEERMKVNRVDGGEHWIKVTFESAQAADAAIYASPQRILGHLVYAEPYKGMPPPKDEAIPDLDSLFAGEHERSKSMPAAYGQPRRKSVTSFPTSFNSRLVDLNNSPPQSLDSSQTLETGTLSSGTVIDSTPAVIGNSGATSSGIEPLIVEDSVFCRSIPTARRAVLLPAEQALKPQKSVTQRILSAIPFINWFSGSIIGNEVPRTETGDFDWNRASLYWKIIWWLDSTFGLFRGDISSIDKDE